MRSFLTALFCGVVLADSASAAPVALDEESPWPRVRSTNGNTVTLHLPQVENWTSNSFKARAAVEVKLAKAKKDLLGVVWIEANGSVNHSNRLVTLDRIELTKGRFPEATDGGSNALAAVREVLPAGARTVSLDYLITALGFDRAAARQGAGGLKHAAPSIIWATNRTVLVVIDGEPALRPVPDSQLERVINTPALLVRYKPDAKFYLLGDNQWFSAAAIHGPWALAQTPPTEVASLSPPPTNAPPAVSAASGPPPRIIISTSPAEVVMTSDLPDFRPIRGTSLQYAADSDSQLFFHTKDREAYVLLSGRWFKAKSLNGPWDYVSPRDLPPDFAKIPPGTAQGIVLASVPDTPQAELALLANSVPTTATVKRSEAKIELTYDGEPQFKPIEGTQMSYAINAKLPVIRTGDKYYAVDDAVWFLADSATGPWQVATEVPEEIYTIPPSSPVYYATFASIYDADQDQVEVGYTPGYQGAYEDDGTVVYGTGYDYTPWYGSNYYGWGWTWGYGYWYVPWYSWWVWRPWWNPPGGLRAALIENIYDRWQGRNGVIHHDRPAGTAAGTAARSATARARSGYPALYGRFAGSTRPVALAPPANSIALNPYSRPTSRVAPGETPRGAQLLSSVRQAPGAGRDLYASPDGNVYRRQDNGWYRRDPGGKWNFVSPTQGKLQNERAAVGRAAGTGAAAAGAGAVYRPGATGAGAATAGAAAMNRRDDFSAGNRAPNVGGEARSQDVANLERQYYARSLAQMRTKNVQPARRAGRRR